MDRSRTRAIALALTTTLVLGVAGSAQGVTDRERARLAAAFIEKKQAPDGSVTVFSSVGSTADAVLAFVAAGRGEEPLADALRYLRRQTAGAGVKGVGLKAKVALAVESAGRNAHAFGGRDLIAELLASQSPFGRFKGASVLDQALALLAILAADGIPNGAGSIWLRNAQCLNGGWAYDAPYAASDGDDCSSGAGDFYTSDTNTTAYAVMALVAWDTPKYDVFGYFDGRWDTTYMGWGYTAEYPTTDANSTALVIQAYLATGEPLPKRAMKALRALQYGCGAFAYSYDDEGRRTGKNLGATIAAVPALRKLPFPYEGDVAGALPASTCRGG
ncbi:MAG TPA: hypothetical protein VF235_00670 [Actinomycetota bacterium]